MLKKNLFILLLGALSGVMPAVCMEQFIRVPKTVVTIRTNNGDLAIDKEQANCSETLKNLIEAAEDNVDQDGIPLPNVTGPLLTKIKTLLRLVVEKKVLDKKAEQTAADLQRIEDIKEEMRALVLSYDGATLMEFIAAVNYLDVPILLNLAIDVAKQEPIKDITFDKIASLPWQIRNPIISGQMIRMLGPVAGTQRAVFNGHTNLVDSVCISQDGTTIASGASDGTVRIWNRDGTQRAVCNGHANWVYSVCISQDGTTIVSGSRDVTVRIWNRDGTQRAVCNSHAAGVRSVCISQDGATIVSGSDDGTVRLWNRDGTQHAVCNGHAARIRSVCISQDGTTIVSGSDDGTVRLWNRDGTQRAICNGHTNWVTSVCISQDGTRIASGSIDRTVRIWNIDWIFNMSNQEAQLIWAFLQSDHVEGWDGIRAILYPENWVTRIATVLGAGAAIGVLGWCAYKWSANNSNE